MICWSIIYLCIDHICVSPFLWRTDHGKYESIPFESCDQRHARVLWRSKQELCDITWHDDVTWCHFRKQQERALTLIDMAGWNQAMAGSTQVTGDPFHFPTQEMTGMDACARSHGWGEISHAVAIRAQAGILGRCFYCFLTWEVIGAYLCSQQHLWQNHPWVAERAHICQSLPQKHTCTLSSQSGDFALATAVRAHVLQLHPNWEKNWSAHSGTHLQLSPWSLAQSSPRADTPLHMTICVWVSCCQARGICFEGSER